MREVERITMISVLYLSKVVQGIFFSKLLLQKIIYLNFLSSISYNFFACYDYVRKGVLIYIWWVGIGTAQQKGQHMRVLIIIMLLVIIFTSMCWQSQWQGRRDCDSLAPCDIISYFHFNYFIINTFSTFIKSLRSY